ncbi:MAG TPA: NACHT domain-containing protein [Ideonella sp.]|nr:NACHT domain-containing protein [Ideonella sp.]
MTDRDLPLTARTRPAAVPTPRWRVRVLGGLALEDEHQVLHRFPSRAAAILLARLAMQPARAHPREELIELLWPGVELPVGRNRLRQALSTLKALLEPGDGAPFPVLQADRLALRVVPGALACDANDFERCVREGRSAEAAALYLGELLPGHYDEWVDDERLRLEALHGRLPAASSPPTPLASAPAAPVQRTPGSPGRTSTARSAAARPAAASSTTASAAPPAALPRLASGRLPNYLTRYFAEDIALSRLRAALGAQRLLVLIGPGGAGKTRTAVELARGWGESGAAALANLAFVSLVDCTDAAAMAQAVASALGLSTRGDALADVPTALEGRDALLLLDNFEQLPPAADALLGEWCARLPRLRLLVTSRRLLAVDGAFEMAAPVLPPPADAAELSQLAHHPAMAMFIDRARAVRPEFQLKASNREALVALLRELDGLPLAIELAAARLRSLPPAQLARALALAQPGASAHLDLLARPGSRESSRHATMRRVIAWSWQSLAPGLAARAAALSVFRGPFELAAAAAVAELGVAPDEARTAAWLDELVGHSLLRALPSDDETPRYQLSEPVREYAAEQLSAEQGRALQRRLCSWLASWAARWPATPPLADIRAQWPTLVAAIDSAVADQAFDEALRLCAPLAPRLVHMGLPERTLQALAPAIAQCTDPALAGHASAVIAVLCFNAAHGEWARQHAAAALRLAPADAPRLRALALYADVLVRWRGHPQPESLQPALDEALTLATQAADDTLATRCLLLLAAIATVHAPTRGEASVLIAQALGHAQRSGNRHLIGDVQYRVGLQMRLSGHAQDSLAQFESVERSTRELQNWELLSTCLNAQGNSLRKLRRWADAVRVFRESIAVAWQCMAMHDLAYPLWNLPSALARTGAAEAALKLLAFTARFWERHFDPLAASELRYLRRIKQLARRHARPSVVEAWWAEGEQLELTEAVTLAMNAAG